MAEPVENVTIQNVTVTDPYNGIDVARYGHGTTIRNVRVEESFDAGIKIESADDALVEGSTVVNSSRSAIAVTSATATLRDNSIVDPDETAIDATVSSTTTVRRNEITGAEIGIEAGDGSESTIVENEIDETAVGIDVTVQAEFQTESALLHRIEDNAIAAKTGVRIGFPASSEPLPDGTDYTGVQIRANDFSESTVAIEETTPNAGPLDARLNYYGPAGPVHELTRATDRPTVSGDVLADPFLPTADASAADVGDDGFSTSIELAAGESYAVGVPGPVSGTVGDMLTDFEGVVYGFDTETGSWTQRTDGDSVDALDALLVVPDTNTTVVMDFGASDNAPPSPSAHDLAEGWNFVAAPQYAPANQSFGHSSAAISVVSPYFEQPGNQLADSDDPGSSFPIGEADETPTVSAFTGYFVFAEDDGQLPARVGEDTSVDSFYAELGIGDRPSVAVGDEVTETTLSVATREAIRSVEAAAPGPHEDNVSATFEQALFTRLADIPAEERATFVDIASDDLVTTLGTQPSANAAELEALVEETVEETTLVSAGDDSGHDGSATETGSDTASTPSVTPQTGAPSALLG